MRRIFLALALTTAAPALAEEPTVTLTQPELAALEAAVAAEQQAAPAMAKVRKAFTPSSSQPTPSKKP